MENTNHYPHFLIITLIFFTTFTPCTSSTTTTNTTPSSATPSPPLPTQELNNILDALIGSGDTTITKWLSILSMSNPSLSLTLFIPQQTLSPSSTLDPFTFPYHIVPQRLSFADLLLLPRYSRLPTLLPGKTIAITDNSIGNFTIDDVLLTHPDLYNTSSLAVHGIERLLDYSTFGDDASMMPNSPNFLPVGETWKSDAFSAAVSIFLLVICFVLQQLIFFV
ncbi:fasciclin-like arabinogalactan protein 21 [Vicia villosa]|uniref:fasciclin-like arabinogalactan protein 21 n=1 Tax=Vicia villosa TaxID=3911 RepID=UPI00273BF190|nr:fasciclin-like arabinogalactan protein 21 [Vicia villosa]